MYMYVHGRSMGFAINGLFRILKTTLSSPDIIRRIVSRLLYSNRFEMGMFTLFFDEKQSCSKSKIFFIALPIKTDSDIPKIFVDSKRSENSVRLILYVSFQKCVLNFYTHNKFFPTL